MTRGVKYAVGSDNNNWKGGRIVHGEYILIWKPEHRYANRRGYIPEHRVIYEQYYNCCVLPWADIHHKNGVKDDNRPENLEGMTKSLHTSLTNRTRVRVKKEDVCQEGYSRVRHQRISYIFTG